MTHDDGRRAEAKAIPILDVAERLGITSALKRAGGREWVGPCPIDGCGGDDRFGINTQTDLFNCRTNHGGGDQIRLVELVLGLSFKDALTWLVGGGVNALSPEEEARRRRELAEQERKRKEGAEKYRQKAIQRGRAIWSKTTTAKGSPVADYLRLRGMPEHIAANPPVALRYYAELPYMVCVNQTRNEWAEWHKGPAMVAGIQNAKGEVIAAHRTWIDLDQPGGKAVICNPDTGEPAITDRGHKLPAKKVEGSKKGGAIRLSHPSDQHFTTLVMGEGIETTLSAMAADAVPDAAYWAGVDLGNMAGQMQPGGKGERRWSGLPDMSDEDAFVPPPWIARLIYLQDGDSDPKKTRAQLMSGLLRAKLKNPKLICQIAHAGTGLDLNDVLMGKDADV